MSQQENNYEMNIKRLEEIIARLERGEIPLEEGLSCFEEGIALVKRCQACLDRATHRVQVLMEGELTELADLKKENGVE